jgi:hypothetical protein
MDHALGCEAWIVPGFSGSSLIAIKVRLEAICHGGYYVDEPIERCIPNAELYSRQGAYIVLRSRMLQDLANTKDETPDSYEFIRNVRSSLFKFRIYQLNLVRYLCEQGKFDRHPTFALTDKRKDKDWFVIEHIDEQEVDNLVNARTIHNDFRVANHVG